MATENQAGSAGGTVDYAGAAAYMLAATGAEGSQADQPNPEETKSAAEPEFVEVSIRGRKVKMSAEDAAAYQDFIREVRERDGRLGGEISQLRERIAKTEGAIEATTRGKQDEPAIKPPPPELAIENFAEYHRQMLAYNEASVRLQRVELETAYLEREQAKARAAKEAQEQSAFADGFFARNPEYTDRDSRLIVTAAYKDHYKEIDALYESGDSDAAYERLAEVTAEKLVALKSKGKNLETNKPPRLEGAGAPAGKSKAEAPKPAFSAAAWKQKRHAARK